MHRDKKRDSEVRSPLIKGFNLQTCKYTWKKRVKLIAQVKKFPAQNQAHQQLFSQIQLPGYLEGCTNMLEEGVAISQAHSRTWQPCPCAATFSVMESTGTWGHGCLAQGFLSPQSPGKVHLGWVPWGGQERPPYVLWRVTLSFRIRLCLVMDAAPPNTSCHVCRNSSYFHSHSISTVMLSNCETK